MRRWRLSLYEGYLSDIKRRPYQYYITCLCVLSMSLPSCVYGQDFHPFAQLEIFSEVLSLIELHHVNPVNQEHALQGAIEGMLSSLDPHSRYLSPQQYEMLKSDTQGKFGGIGVVLESKDGWLVVLSVLPGGPAKQAGLKPGDRIMTIDFAQARDLPLHVIAKRLRGEPGTQVQVRLRRGERDISFTLKRAHIEVESTELMSVKDGIAHVRLHSFQQGASRELAARIEEAKQHSKDLKGMILDLRHNGGGLVNEAVSVVDLFLPKSRLVSEVLGRDLKVSRRHHTQHAQEVRVPVVVLLNAFSASASEIVAGALQDTRRACVVGVRSFGKGSVQQVIPLDNGGALKLTTGVYVTPSGRSIQAQGVQPDVWVPNPDDVQYDLPVEALLSKHLKQPGMTPKSKKDKPVQPDVKGWTMPEAFVWTSAQQDAKVYDLSNSKRAYRRVSKRKDFDRQAWLATEVLKQLIEQESLP